MDPIHERFKEVRLALGFKQNAFGELFGISGDAISAIERGRAKPTLESIGTLATMGVNTDWLLRGVGEMFFKETPEQKPKYPKPHQQFDASPKGENTVYAEILSLQVSAGKGKEPFDTSVIGRYPLYYKIIHPYQPEHVKVVEANGDSMTPTIYDGDFIFFVPGEIKSDGIYVIRFLEYLMVKRIQFQLNGNVFVISDNPRYEKQVMKADNDDFQIIGKVIGWCHKHRY